MVLQLLEQFGYLAILGVLIAAGVGIPFPEELTQLTAGFLAHEGILRLGPAIAVCWIGIVTGDLIWFLLSRRAGPRILSSRPVARVLTDRRRAWLGRHFTRHAFWTLVVARHTSGLRLPAFALAATHGVGVPTFLLADGLSALASVPLVVGAGYLFSEHLAAAHRGLRLIELGILAALAVVALAVLWIRRRRAGRAREPAGG